MTFLSLLLMILKISAWTLFDIYLTLALVILLILYFGSHEDKK